MGLTIKKEMKSGQVVVFQKVLETARGGFKLVTDLPNGTLIKAGTPVKFDEATRKMTIPAVAQLATANGLLYDDVVVSDNEFADAVTRGTVYARRIPLTMNSEQKTALKGALPLIIFSESF